MSGTSEAVEKTLPSRGAGSARVSPARGLSTWMYSIKSSADLVADPHETSPMVVPGLVGYEVLGRVSKMDSCMPDIHEPTGWNVAMMPGSQPPSV